MQALAALFRRESTRRLSEEYLPRIRRAVETLGDDLWWRPHEGTTSAGNLLLHLEGNVRQWILAGLGGAGDHRRRSEEFLARAGEDPLPALARTVEAACGVIEGLDGEALDRPVVIQGFETTGLGAVYHVVEHFSWHTGQIVWIAKLRGSEDHGIAFFDDGKLE